MKKILFFLCILFTSFSFSSCKKDDNKPDNNIVTVNLHITIIEGNVLLKYKNESGKIVEIETSESFYYSYKAKVGERIYFYAQHKGDSHNPLFNGVAPGVFYTYPNPYWPVNKDEQVIVRAGTVEKGTEPVIVDAIIMPIEEYISKKQTN